MKTDVIQNSVYVDRGALSDLVKRIRESGRSIVLANGCFDVLHVGHIRYIEAAKSLGDILIVAINSDDQVRRLKGDGRPFQSADERAEIIAALRVVDHVTVFSEPTVEKLISLIRPDVHAKGTDYTEDSVPEREYVLAYGGKIAIVGDPKDHSSTEMMDRITRLRQ